MRLPRIIGTRFLQSTRYKYLGYYFLLQSDYETSKDYWNKILAIDPNDALAKTALEGIEKEGH